MHIDAALRTLNTDLPPRVRHALLVVACRANQTTGQLTRSVPALAADMGVSPDTARRALHVAIEAGYLQVSHGVGISSTYTLRPPLILRGGTPSKTTTPPLAKRAQTPSKNATLKRKTDKDKGAATPQRVGALLKTRPPARGNGSTWVPDRRPLPTEGDC